MLKLTIDRTKWHRGAGSANSALKNDLARYCCLGFDALNLGFSDSEIFGCPTPEELYAGTRCSNRENRLPGLVCFDGASFKTNTCITKLIVDVNDFRIGQSAYISQLRSTIHSVDGLTEYLEAQSLQNNGGFTLRTEADREAILTLCFRSIGREVTFVN